MGSIFSHVHLSSGFVGDWGPYYHLYTRLWVSGVHILTGKLVYVGVGVSGVHILTCTLMYVGV